MKFRHRIKFTIDNISLHGKQVRAGIFMSFFAFLVLGVTVFIFKTTGQFRKDTQKAFAEDISGVGCIEISSDDEKKAMDFINRMRTQVYITMAGSISEYEISQENWDAVSTRQSVNKRIFDELRDADSYTEVLFVQKDVFSLFDIRLKKGSEDVNTVMKKGYVPLYVGYKYQKDLKIGDVLPDSDDFEYMVAGYIDKNQSMPVNSMVTVDKFSFYTTTSLDYALIAVVDWEPDACGGNMYFEIADGYKFQDVKYRLTLLAGQQGVETVVSNIAAVMDAADASTKSIRQYLFDLFVIVAISICVSLTCFQSMNILTRKYEYGILYANGFNETDMILIIVFEECYKMLVSLILVLPVLSIIAKYFFEAIYESQRILNQIMYKNVLPVLILAGAVITAVSSVFPIVLIKKNSASELIGDKT